MTSHCKLLQYFVLQADVTLEGLYNLLAAVQESFPSAFTPEEFYRTTYPASAVRRDIIDSANRGTTLSHVGTKFFKQNKISINIMCLYNLSHWETA